MFYAESLLTKTGPLAAVWLAANIERKLTKKDALSSDLETNVKDIIGTNGAPMALRLSGQLLLGVVRIYKRKAEYLLGDCSEALLKIKMAFRPANVDLPANQSHTANPNTLMLPDTITELDLFAPLPDPDDLLLDEPARRGPGQDPTLLDFGTSQLLPSTQTTPRKEQNQMLDLMDDGLGLDLGLDDEPDVSNDRSIEIGRRATTVRPDEPSALLGDDDLGLDIGLDDNNDTTIMPPVDDGPLLALDDDYPMAGMDGPGLDEIHAQNEAALARLDKNANRARDTVSPLSSIRSSAERELERTFQLDRTAIEEQEDPTIVQAAQRVKRRRVMQLDAETELRNHQIKAQQEDTSAITKAPSFLPRDPLLLQLMEMSKSGAFVSNIMGPGRLEGWAPELRSILSLEVIRRPGELKRKRDSGVADLDTDAEAGAKDATPQLEIPQDEDEGFQMNGDADAFGGATTLHSDGLAPPLADDVQPIQQEDEQEEEEAALSPGGAPFDTTEAPLLHPSQSGPVSLGTKNAVHLLREHFAPGHTSGAIPPTPSKRTKNDALFTDLCPEAATSRQDATKLFFELLVLGTKDAVKVEQGAELLGGPIRVRGKRGLWGDWAEMGAGGEIAGQSAAAEVGV